MLLLDTGVVAHIWSGNFEYRFWPNCTIDKVSS